MTQYIETEEANEISRKIDKPAYYASEVPGLKINGNGQAMGLCVFHDDSEPSLSVDLNRGMANCFGCGWSGNIFHFHMKKYGVEFPEAALALADRAGVHIERSKEYQNKGRDPKPEAKAPEGISYITLHDLSQEQHEDVPVIENFAHEEDITMIHAAGGVGKTTIIQNLFVTAGSYTEPLTPQDRYLLWGKFEIKKECLSIIIQSEMSRRFASIRMQKMIEGNTDLQAGAKNVIMPLVDDNVSITGESIDDPLFLTWISDLINKVEQDRGREVNFVAFDPLISFHDRDENSSELRRALDKLRKVFEKTNTILIFSHHDNKNEKTYRGTTAIWDFCRNSIHIEPTLIGDTPALKFINNKCNHRLPFKDFHLRRDEHLNFELITNTDALSSSQTARCHSIQNIFSEVKKPKLTHKELVTAYQVKTGVTPDTAKRHIKEAENHMFITKKLNQKTEDLRQKYTYEKNPNQP